MRARHALGPLRRQREDVHPQPRGRLLQPLPAAHHHADLRRPELRGRDEHPARRRRRGRQRCQRRASSPTSATYDYLGPDRGRARRGAGRARGRRPRLRARHPARLVGASAGDRDRPGRLRQQRRSGAGPGRPGTAPAGGRAGALRAGGSVAGRRRASSPPVDVRVRRVARPRLHRLPRPGHRRA